MYLGAQLYGFPKEVLLQHTEKLFKTLSAMGYQAVELPFPLECASLLNDCKLRCAALHTGPDALLNLPELMAYLARHECHNVLISGPLGWHDRSLDNFRASCKVINDAAATLKAAGISTHYHNHDFEFLASGAGEPTPFDILLGELDLENVGLCVDIGWVHPVGLDPVAFLERHAKRIAYLHLRDFSCGQSVALGEGEVNLAEVIEHLHLLPKLEWVVVEFEPTENALENFRESKDFWTIGPRIGSTS